MKYSKSAIGLLTAQYRSVLKKCWLINVGLFALGAAVATPANADYTPVDTKVTVAADEATTLDSNSFTGLVNSNGGAVNNAGTTTIKDSLFSGNSAKGDSHQYGGAIYNSNKLTISGTEFLNNSAVYGTNPDENYVMLGGAIYNTGSGDLTIDDSQFIGNSVNSGKPRGAAIWNTANATITNSTFQKNETINSRGFSDMMGSAIYHTSGTMTLEGNTFGGDNTTDGNIGASAFVANSGTVHFKDNTFKNNAGGAVNLQGAAVADFSGTHVFSGTNGSGDETAALYLSSYNNPTATFKSGGTNTFSNNNATVGAALRTYKYGDFTDASVTFEKGSNNTFSNNTATTNGGAVYNQEQTLTLNGTFTNNSAGEKGGAIYNTANGTINFNDTTTFSGNTANNSANDIYNAGTINFGGTADLAGGIDGEAGTVNVSGDVKVANALKNQTVNVNAGELHLDAANVTGSTVNLASDAVLNTINNAIEDYSAIKLADGSNIKVDANLNLGQMDLFSAAYGHDTIDLNIVETNMIGSSADEVTMQLVNNGVKVNTSSIIYEWDGEKHTKTGIVGSGNADGKVKVSNGVAVSSLEIAADETDAGTKESVVYEMGENEDFGSATVENANFIVEGNNQSVNVSGSFGIDNQSVVTINNATFNGEGSIDTQGKLKITDSNINVDVNVTGGASLESDPTEFSGTITVDSSSTGAFDGDTFKSTAVLKNSGTVDFTDMTFESGSKIESDTATAGTLNFNGGDYKLPITNNNINLKDGAKIALLEGSDIDGLTLTNDANNGTIDLRNNRIDTLGSTTLGSDLNVLMDIDLTADKSDTLGTITGGYGLNLGAVELLKLGDTHEEIQIATAGTNVALSADAINTLKTYYTTVSYDAGTGILTLDGKASPVTDLIGSWGTGNYIKAYNSADAANTSVGANLGYLDTQVKTNADEIASAQTAIGGINDDITVATAGNYIAAGTEVANNLTALDTQAKANADAIATKQDATVSYSGTNYLDSQTTLTGADVALDTQVKANADAIATKLTGAEAADYAVSGKRGAELAANIATYVAANGDKFADVQNTTNIITDLFNDKAAYIQETTGMDQAHSVAYNYNQSTQDLLHGATSMLNADEKLAQAIGTKQDAAVSYSGTNYLDSQTTLTGADVALDTQVKANADAIATKQAQLVNDKTSPENISNVVATTIRASDAASDTVLVTEKAISTALETKVNNAGNFTADTNSALIKNKTVVAAIQDTAAQVDINTAKNGTQDTGLANLYTLVNGGTYNAADASVTGATALSSNFTATNLTAAANELLGDITVAADGNYISAGANVAGNLSALDGQVKTNTDNITSTMALVGTTSAPKAGTGILAGKTITGTAGTDNLNMVDAIAYVAANAAGLNVDNVYTGKNTFGATEGSQVIITNGGSMSVDKNLTIGKANAISSNTNATIDMGENTLTNVKGLTLTDGNTHTASLSANENGLNTSSNLTVGGYIKATGIDTSTANTVNLGGTGFTTAVTGDMTVSGDTALGGDLDVDGDLTVDGTATLNDVDVAGDLTVAGDTTLADTKVDGDLEVTGAATFGDTTDKFVDITSGAITVHDGTGSANVTASIANNGNITTKGTLDVAGLASLDGGINVNDKFAVDTNGKVTLSDGTNTATIEATQIKDSDGNPINNVMKVDGTGLYTGYVASESGFTVAQKDGSTGNYIETFTVNEDGDIESKGTLSVSDGKFAVDGDGAVKAADGAFTVDKDGAVVAANGGFTVAADGKTAVGNDFRVTDKFTVAGATGNTVVGGNLAVRDKFTVDADTGNTAVAGTFSAAEAKFTVDGDGAVKAADGNFTVDKDGNTAVAGTMDIEGDTTIGDKFSVKADDGSFSAAGGKFAVNENGSIAAANNQFVVNKDGNITKAGTISAADGKFLVKDGGEVSAADGKFLVKDGGLVTAAAGKFQVKDGGALSAAAGHFTVSEEGAVLAKSLAFEGDGSTVLVNKIDQGAAAITDGVADTDARKETMATTATVAKTIGNLAALYDGSATAASHGVTNVADVASAIDSLSQNVETATGGTFAGATWTGTVSGTKAVNYAQGVSYNDIMSAVDQVSSNIGTETTVAYNNVAAGNTVNANIDALNSKVGDMNTIGYGYKNLSNGTTTQPGTVVEALQNIDASMGTIHGLAAKLQSEGKYQGNLAEGTTVEQHLTALDSAIGNRAKFDKMHYTQGSKTVVDAIGKLDTKLNSVDHDVRVLRHKFQSGMASAAALSALVPNARAHGNTQLSLGTGMYHGHGAMAVGGFHWFTDNLLFNTGIAWDDNEATYRMGVTYSW